MELVLLVALLALLFWWLGFFKSGRRLANISNRAVTDLEMAQAQNLKQKYTGKDLTDIKKFTEQFDAL